MDAGRELVDEYDKLRMMQEDFKYKIEQLKTALVSFARQQGKETLFGTHKVCSVKPYEKVIYPEDKTAFLALIKEKGLFEQFSTLNYLKLGSRISKGDIDAAIIALTKRETDFRVSLKDRGT